MTNATIESVEIEKTHGIFTINIGLDYGTSSHQSFGGYCIAKTDHPRLIMDAWIVGLMETFGVERLSDLKGKPCRVEATHSKVEFIGHFCNDKWFKPEEVMEGMQE